MRLSIFLTLFVSVVFSQFLMAESELPSCFHISSDQDGDGFGYENAASCVVDDSTRSIAEPGLCVDENADGYGWNGVESCPVEVVSNPDCEDTLPVGDGWGWDGIAPCRVVPQRLVAISELEIIKSHLRHVEEITLKEAAFYCPDTDETFTLKINSVLERYVGQGFVEAGMWSTGLYDRDNIVHVGFSRIDRYHFIIQEEGVQLKRYFGDVLCTWFAE